MVGFLGLIKEIRKFTASSGDKTVTIKIETNALGNEEVLNEINSLDLPEVGIGFVVMSAEEFAIWEQEALKKKK